MERKKVKKAYLSDLVNNNERGWRRERSVDDGGRSEVALEARVFESPGISAELRFYSFCREIEEETPPFYMIIEGKPRVSLFWAFLPVGLFFKK